MKKIVAILLFFALLTPLLVTYSSFKLRQKAIHKSVKRQIKKGVAEKDLVLLKIPFFMEEKTNPDFQRIHAKEFRYKGEMYDIVKQHTQNDTTYYFCIWDKEETALFAELDKLILKAVSNNPVQKQENQKLISFFKGMFCEEIEACFYLNGLANKPHNLYLNLYKSHIAEKLIPPPEITV